VTRPKALALDLAFELLEPWRKITRPKFVGLDRIPDERPLLFVGNHTLFGVLDVPLMFRELWRKKGIFPRALGDHGHFDIPVWGDFLKRFGVVDGTRENCTRLMQQGECVLVFPGGAREVAKRKGESYQLIWKDRLGFAKMALQNDCTIVPFAAVGADDAYDIIVDGDELLATPLGKLAKNLGLRTDFVPPIAKGFKGTPLPKPQRFYFEFAEPIRMTKSDDAVTVRDRTKAAIEAAIDNLLELRDRDLPDPSPPTTRARPRPPSP
jgi:1-acyl-sn-glycerol-3-phosphate acyltransferase